jgi:hypothetical protein
MASNKLKFKKSTAAALLTLGFFGGLFTLGLSDPPLHYARVCGGILISSILTVYYSRTERRDNTKTSRAGLWIVAGIFIAFLLLCVLPALF